MTDEVTPTETPAETTPAEATPASEETKSSTAEALYDEGKGKEGKPEGEAEKAKAEGEKEGEGKSDDDAGKGEDEDDKKAGAPEAYEDFALPEGVSVDEASMGGFKDLAKKHNLSQEAAQEFVNFDVARQKEAQKALTEAQDASWKKMQTEWVTASKDDPEIGGKAYDENVAIALKGVEAFGGDALKEAFEVTGVGDHPEFIRAFWQIGKLVKSGDLVGSAGQKPKSNERRPTTQVFYGEQSS